MGDEGEEGKKSLNHGYRRTGWPGELFAPGGKCRHGKNHLSQTPGLYPNQRARVHNLFEDISPVLIFLKDFWPLYQKEMKKESPAVNICIPLDAYFKKFNVRCLRELSKISWGKAGPAAAEWPDEVPEEIRASWWTCSPAAGLNTVGTKHTRNMKNSQPGKSFF